MSLKHFHVAFITVSVIFFLGFSAWCLLVPALPEMFQLMGWLSLAFSAGMLIYGVSFLRKSRSIIQ